MDSQGTAGQLQFLQMKATTGTIPHDPFLLRLSVEKHIGGPIVGAFKENRGISYVLKVRSQGQFNKLLQMKKLTDGTEICIEEHPSLNQVKCVVSNADTVGLTDKYIVDQLQNQRVKDIKRIKRKTASGQLEDTPTIILTIRGTVVPDHIDFGWTRCRTRNYYPTPMQCFRCWAFGHTGKRCTEPHRICGKCSQVHMEDQAPVTPAPNEEEGATALSPPKEKFICPNPVCCKNCNMSKSHAASSRECPLYKKETAIQRIRVDHGLSYPQARREYEAQETKNDSEHKKSSYTGVTSASKDTEISELKATINQLVEDAKRREKRMAEMEQALENRSVNNRLDTTRQHGTIEELVRQVTELTETVKQLRDALEKKDSIIEKLLADRDFQDVSAISINESTHTEISATPTPKEMANMPKANLDPKVAIQVSNWIKTSVNPTNTKIDSKDNSKTGANRNKYDEESDDSMRSKKSSMTTEPNPTPLSNATKLFAPKRSLR